MFLLRRKIIDVTYYAIVLLKCALFVSKALARFCKVAEHKFCFALRLENVIRSSET